MADVLWLHVFCIQSIAQTKKRMNCSTSSTPAARRLTFRNFPLHQSTEARLERSADLLCYVTSNIIMCLVHVLICQGQYMTSQCRGLCFIAYICSYDAMFIWCHVHMVPCSYDGMLIWCHVNMMLCLYHVKTINKAIYFIFALLSVAALGCTPFFLLVCMAQ